MSQLHVHASPGDVAPFVLLPGDPKRATFIAETFFDSPQLYTDNRGLLGYTGTYKGLPVSVQTTGMGCPSLAIVTEELIRLGATTFVRVGTAGIVNPDINPGELIIADASVPMDGTTRQYLQGQPYAPSADHSVVTALTGTAARGGKVAHVGLIQTEDAFYATTPDHVERLNELGVLAIEMEASALFLLGKMRRVRTGCALVASNHIGDSTFVDPAILTEGIRHMVSVSLEAALLLDA
jgi:purine-nucleoside phosphorylase